MSRLPSSIPGLALSALVLSAAALAACAPEGDLSDVASTQPTVGGDRHGAGGKMDEVYRGIYTPGNPNWSH